MQGDLLHRSFVMKAAVIKSFPNPPVYEDFPEPTAQSDEVIVAVRAAALSQLVRMQAAGKHYTSGTPPFVPGVDGVGLLPDGRRVYFAFPRQPNGAMAERVAVPSAYTVVLPDSVDDITAAAIANPGMSSWAALTERAGFKRGEAVLINGANGASGRLAIQIAKHLGAGRIVVTGRNPASAAELLALGADVFVTLTQTRESLVSSFREEIAAGIDVVLDYLWGPASEAFLVAATGHGAGEAARRIRFVNIGSLGGTSIDLPAAALRSSGVEMLGSGLGSVSNLALIRSIAALMQAIEPAQLKIDAQSLPLRDVQSAWTGDGGARIVFTV
jgi:NADPH:quinone reductase-like Zn-dependent oxidoreductase